MGLNISNFGWPPNGQDSPGKGRISPGFARIWARIQGRIGPGLAQDSLSNLVAGFTQAGQAVGCDWSLGWD